MADHDALVRRLTKLVREIDPEFEKEGGSTRHWVRDFFLPALDADGLAVVEVAERDRYREALERLTGWRFHVHDDGEYVSIAHGLDNDTLLKMPDGWRDREVVRAFAEAVAGSKVSAEEGEDGD